MIGALRWIVFMFMFSLYSHQYTGRRSVRAVEASTGSDSEREKCRRPLLYVHAIRANAWLLPYSDECVSRRSVFCGMCTPYSKSGRRAKRTNDGCS